MPTLSVARLTPALAVLVLLAGEETGAAQTADPSIDPASLRRSNLTWNQAEREFGFRHWDWVFGGRLVERGSTVRELPVAAPFAGLAAGTPGGDELERFYVEQKVAGLIVLQDGKVRLERYALGYGPSGRWVSQSVAKSITSTLVGAAVKDGFIRSIDDSVTNYVPSLKGSGYEGVTIRQVMTMTSGMRWNEDYADSTSDIVRFYSAPVTPGVNSTVSALRRLEREAPPGTRWHYNTAETHLLGIIVSSATRRPLAVYLSEKIWGPYGMELPALWMTDRTHQELGGCCLHVGLRDYARFGQFVLEDGRVAGRAVVPDGWFAEATRRQQQTTSPSRGYGFQWWVAQDATFDAIGINGQLIHIDPARRLVVAMSSAWPVATAPERSAARDRMLATIAAQVDAEGRR